MSQNDEKKGLDRFNREINFSNEDETLDNISQDNENKNDNQEEQEVKEITFDTGSNEDINEDISIETEEQEDKGHSFKEINEIVQTETVNSNEIDKSSEEETQEVSDEVVDEILEEVEEIKEDTSKDLEEPTQTTEGYQAPKFVIDIDEDAYNTSDFEAIDDENYDNEEDEEDEEEISNKKPKKKTSALGMFFRIILAFILIGMLAFGAIAGVYAYGDISGITGNGIPVKVTVPPDTYVSDVGEILKENGIIKYPPIFKLYIKYIHKEEVNLHYGNFNLNSSMSYKQLLEVLQNPAQSESGIKLTIREGENITDIARRLEESHICKSEDFLNAVANGNYEYPFIGEIKNPQERMFRLEGYLFPDTYNFKQDTKPEEIIKTMLSNFESKFTSEMKYAIEISPYSFDEIITLASIIQAEAPTKPDMMKVSSVYRNRLANPEEYPKLQADPTSKYANRVLIPAGASQEMAVKYDTYKSQGLPVGPINNPGLEAILSAIFPATTDDYYFCSDLTSGQFYYAQTYEQHKINLELAGLTEKEATE